MQPGNSISVKSMCGKVTERNNRKKSKTISDTHELYVLLATPGNEIANLVFDIDDEIWASLRFVAEEVFLS